MSRINIVIFILLCFYWGCTKKIFPTTPYVAFEKADLTEVFIGQSLELVYSVRDNEGDIGGTIILYKDIINQNQAPRTLSINFPPPKDLPQKRKFEGRIKFSLDYFTNIGSPLTFQNDTVRFGLRIIDIAGNESDTAFSTPIVILK